MEKVYCWFCGALRKGTKMSRSYDTRTGKPNSYWFYACPNRKWFMFWHEEYQGECSYYPMIPGRKNVYKNN